jgi:hypothetical protein
MGTGRRKENRDEAWKKRFSDRKLLQNWRRFNFGQGVLMMSAGLTGLWGRSWRGGVRESGRLTDINVGVKVGTLELGSQIRFHVDLVQFVGLKATGCSCHSKQGR